MPIMRDYGCPNGHVTEDLHLGSASTAPVQVSCKTCGASAIPIIAAKLRNKVRLPQRW